MLAAVAGGEGSGFAGALIGVFGVGIALFLAFIGFVTLMAGYGTMQRKSWGRWLAVILSVLHVLSFSWMSPVRDLRALGLARRGLGPPVQVGQRE